MKLHVFRETMQTLRRSIIGWSIGVVLAVVLMSAIWPSFSDVDFNAMLEQYPQGLMEVFNVNDMSTATGFLNTELFSLMLPIAFVIFAVGRGARLIAAEEEDGTMEILATMPISRTQLLLEKALGLVAAVLCVSVALFVSTQLCSAVFSLDVSGGDAVIGSTAMFLLGIDFGLIALGLSAATGRRGLALGAATGLAAAAYMLYVAAQLIDGLRPYLKLSPFYQALSAGPLAPELPLLALALPTVGLIALAASVPIFTRRDLSL